MVRIGFAVCLFAALAVAETKLTLEFADGKKKSVTLVSFDGTGLVVKRGGDDVPVAWNELKAESAFAARKALTPYDDGAARLELSEFARALKLYPEALEQLEIALALGGLDEGAFEKRAAELEKEEVFYLTAHIDTLLRSGADPAECLVAIKRLKERYPEHPANARYEEEIDTLVEQLAKLAEEEQAKKAKAVDSKELAKLRKLIEKINKRKFAALDKADDLIAESKDAIEKRQVSRVKKKLVEPMGAEKYLKRARGYLREMARADREFRIVTREGLRKEDEEIAGKLVGCYLEVARSQMKQRNYKGAKEYVRKVLLYDPIHEEALEMVDEIRRNRISFKLSEITNAKPRVTGG